MSNCSPKDSNGDKKRSRDDSIAVVCWNHYRDYVDSLDQEEGGDIDEIWEIIQHLEDIKPTTVLGKTCEELLPVLASVAHYQIATYAMTQTIDSSITNAEFDQATILKHLQSSLRYFPLNCSTWSIGANYARINQTVPPIVIANWYQKAAEFASQLRTQTIQLLEHDDDVHDEAKEWLELLVLNGVVGSEYSDDNDSEEEEDEADDPEGATKLEPDEDRDAGFSASSVEATSRFMAAMILSAKDEHDAASKELCFFDLTHRLHPNVWKHVTSSNDAAAKSNDPVYFTGNVLPESIKTSLLHVFDSQGSFWKESDYAHRGYFSFFFNIPEKPSNLIEHVICTYLLPLAKERLSDTDNEIIGAEWWTHIRPIKANLGHNFHFDTDESLLHQEGVVTHPILSSVLYLSTGDGSAGSTVVLDQTPDSKKTAGKGWICKPQENSFMIFPGNMLHGVLPCPGKADTNHDNKVHDADTLGWECPSEEQDVAALSHRLTFMVGFWTRSVPDKMENPQPYGPCGPLPGEAQWVKQLKSIPTKPTDEPALPETIKSNLPIVSPVWEELATASTCDNALEIPKAIDHRYFVKGAPNCFRESLFEKDDEALGNP